jgi:hypothetical protein
MVCGQDFFPYSVLFSPFFSKKISGHCFFTQLLIHEQATSYINTPMLSLSLYHTSLSLASLLSDKEKQEWELLITSPTFALSPAQEANENQCRYSLNLASYQPFSLLFVSVYIVCKREGSLSLFSLSLSIYIYIYISFAVLNVLCCGPFLSLKDGLCYISQTVEIKVKMDCDGCERRVKNAVTSMKGFAF